MNFESFRSRFGGGWKLGIGDTHSPLSYIADTEMAEHQTEHTENGIREIWRGCPGHGASCEIIVNWVPCSGAFAATFEFSGFSGDGVVEEIHFPILKAPYSRDAVYISGSWDLGFVQRGKTAFAAGSRTSMPYVSMQFSALSMPEGGFYVEHRDPEWYVKRADIEISEDGRRMSHASVFSCPCGNKTGRGGIPYEIRVRAFSGTWFEAAMIYREWALKQSWHLSRTEVNPLRKLGMWVWNRGLADQVMPPVERLQQDCGNIPIALDWYWWHSNPYDTEYPDFWPPREGVEKFTQAVRRMKSSGVHTQVYVNGVCWDQDGESWDQGGMKSAIVLRDGNVLSRAFNRYNGHRLAYMCGEAPLFQDRLSSLLKNLHGSGLDGQYLDMIGCSTYTTCYNPEHKHAPGGGCFSVKGYRNMLARMKRENPDYPITIECANEAYMDLTDGAIVCNSISAEHFGVEKEFVPLFCAVYHGRYALFGNYALPDGITPWDPLWPAADKWKNEKAWHRIYPDQFFFEMARPVVWGIQPMVCNLKSRIQEDPEFSGIYQFILQTASFYHANRKFLFDGEMLSPDGFTCESFEIEFHARSIFTREKECRTIRRTMPAVLHSCWRAPDGERALILANYTGKIQSWQFGNQSGSIAPHSYEKRIPDRKETGR